MKRRIGRVDRNKKERYNGIKCVGSERLRSKRNKETANSENNDEKEERFVQRVEKRASRRRLGWPLSREQNCGCLSNPTDRNSISSCISYLPRFSPYPPRDIAVSHSFLFSVPRSQDSRPSSTTFSR